MRSNALKKQKKYYFGKKKRHTFKLQIIANARTKDVICIAVSAEKKHDFALLKDSCVHFSPEIEVLADKGYQGIAQLHANSTTPIKASKNRKLSSEERKQILSSQNAGYILSILTAISSASVFFLHAAAISVKSSAFAPLLFAASLTFNIFLEGFRTGLLSPNHSVLTMKR